MCLSVKEYSKTEEKARVTTERWECSWYAYGTARWSEHLEQSEQRMAEDIRKSDSHIMEGFERSLFFNLNGDWKTLDSFE